MPSRRLMLSILMCKAEKQHASPNHAGSKLFHNRLPLPRAEQGTGPVHALGKCHDRIAAHMLRKGTPCGEERVCLEQTELLCCS